MADSNFSGLVQKWWQKRCDELEQILSMGDDIEALKLRSKSGQEVTITGEQKTLVVNGLKRLAPPLLEADLPLADGLSDEEYAVLLSDWHRDAFLDIRPTRTADQAAFDLLADVLKLPFQLSINIGAGYEQKEA